jgi:hypothetical protein
MKLWKLQKFFGDLVYDLRNRGLLPVVALLLVAMVAVPIVISSGGSSSAPGAGGALEEAANAAPEGEAAVLAYNPGLRDYKQRLDQLQAKDPFRRQFSQAAAAAAALTGTVTGGDGGTAPATDTGTVQGSGGSPSRKTTKTKTKTKTRYLYFQTDVLTGESTQPLTPLNRVAALAPLPSAATPVLIYLGPNADGSYALFLVSNQVSSVTGSGLCIPAPEDCSLLALARDQTGVLVSKADSKTYLIKVVRIRRVVSSKLPNG